MDPRRGVQFKTYDTNDQGDTALGKGVAQGINIILSILMDGGIVVNLCLDIA